MTTQFDDCRQVLRPAKPRKHAVLTDLHDETTRLETRIGQGTVSADCPQRTILKLAQVFDEVCKSGKDLQELILWTN